MIYISSPYKLLIGMAIVLAIAIFQGCKQEKQVNPHLKAIMEDSGLNGWSRYWIGEYLYTDSESVIHTTLNCPEYIEFPGNGHRRVICVDTAEVTRLHAEYFCNVCVGDSMAQIIAGMITRNEKEILSERQ